VPRPGVVPVVPDPELGPPLELEVASAQTSKEERSAFGFEAPAC
jgi:hypothetical protein